MSTLLTNISSILPFPKKHALDKAESSGSTAAAAAAAADSGDGDGGGKNKDDNAKVMKDGDGDVENNNNNNSNTDDDGDDSDDDDDNDDDDNNDDDGNESTTAAAAKRKDGPKKPRAGKRKRLADRQRALDAQKDVSSVLVFVAMMKEKAMNDTHYLSFFFNNFGSIFRAFPQPNAVRIAIDFSMADQMSPKEISKLAGQIRRLYGTNIRSEVCLFLAFLKLK